MEFLKNLITFEKIEGIDSDINSVYQGLNIMFVVSLILLGLKIIAPFVILLSKIPLVFVLFVIVISYIGVTYVKNTYTK